MSTSPGIFLSHSQHDTLFVQRLASDLSRRGARVWYYEAEIAVGDSLIERIGKALDDMDFFGVVLSKNSVASEWVKQELDIAIHRELAEHSIRVLPLLLETCDVPAFLEVRRYADFREDDLYDRGLQEILEAMGLTKKGSKREELLTLARRVVKKESVLDALGLPNWSPSTLEKVPERDEYFRTLDEYKVKVKDYEQAFQEYYDPLSLIRP